MPMVPEGLEMPTIYLNDKQFSDIVGWSIDSEHYIVCKVKMKALESVDYPEEERRGKNFRGELKIKSMRSLGTKPVDHKMLEEEAFAKAKVDFLEGR